VSKPINAERHYVCNPNNPTGTVTPMKDIEYLLANKSGRGGGGTKLTSTFTTSANRAVSWWLG
jgi:hypothetical protein